MFLLLVGTGKPQNLPAKPVIPVFFLKIIIFFNAAFFVEDRMQEMQDVAGLHYAIHYPKKITHHCDATPQQFLLIPDEIC